jgi:DNA adenine methylase
MKKLFETEEEIIKAQPFIKWVGGKRTLVSRLNEMMPPKFNNYFEPFIGGGALLFHLYSEGILDNRNKSIFDINSELINTYNIVKNNPIELIEKLKEYKEKHSNEFYYEIRALDRTEDYKISNKILRATRFIYLNKTCFNGLYRVNKSGYFNVPIGSYKSPNIADENVILNASKALEDVNIYNSSYKEVLNKAKKGDLVYFDPPYYPLNRTSNFTSYSENDFLEKEQEELLEIFDKLAKKGVFVILSNSDTDYIKDLYKNYDINIVDMNRFINSKANGRGKVTEVVVRSW